MIGYDRFVRQRQPLWDAFEAGMARARIDPRSLRHNDLEALALQYRRVLHDHSMAASRFAGTAVAHRLARLALAGAHWLQREKTEGLSLRRFYGHTFPAAFRRVAPAIGLILLLFASSALLGLFAAIAQPEMGVAFLGPQAMQGLREGHMWTQSVFSVTPPSVASSAIATNNMGVAIMAWAGGAAAGLGALYVTLLNGFMLGAVLGVTAHFGMLTALLEFIAAHGPLEITLILVTAGSGMTMGRAVVEATDRPRRDALRDAGRDATAVLLGCLPWFVLLGLVEGFVSPQPTIPPALKAVVGQTLLLLFLVVAINPSWRKETP